MHEKIIIRPIDPDSPDLTGLAVEAGAEGYSFIERHLKEAKSGENRFDKKGECFFGAYSEGKLIACGGVNQDPYTHENMGRLRHIYVSSEARRGGIASLLVKKMLDHCQSDFESFRLRTPDENADQFYEALGFKRTDEKDATHILTLK